MSPTRLELKLQHIKERQHEKFKQTIEDYFFKIKSSIGIIDDWINDINESEILEIGPFHLTYSQMLDIARYIQMTYSEEKLLFIKIDDVGKIHDTKPQYFTLTLKIHEPKENYSICMIS